jgi:SAM-dependent methyltransferase
VNSYTGLHARVYDEIYAEKPYPDEARFVHDLAGSPGGKLLDVACGTGRHARAFADLGYDVTATDINEELLAIGREAAGDRVRFVQGDMCDLNVDGGPFDLVTCLFDSIGYPQEDGRIVAALRSLGRHVAPEGRIVCEFLHAPAMIRGAAPVRLKRLVLRDGRNLVRTSETSVDLERMLMHVQFELWALDDDGLVEHAEEQQTNRIFSAPEMRLLAAAAGLDVHAVVPAFAAGPIGPDTFHLLLVAGAAS